LYTIYYEISKHDKMTNVKIIVIHNKIICRTYPYSWLECDGYPSLCPLSEFVSIHSVSEDNEGTRSEPIELTALSESPPPALPFCTMVAVFIVLLLHGTELLAVSIILTGYIPPIYYGIKETPENYKLYFFFIDFGVLTVCTHRRVHKLQIIIV